MAYSFITVRTEDEEGNQTRTQYIVCESCKSPITANPGTGDWAAYDAPDLQIPTGNKDDNGNPITVGVEQTEVALCSECYLAAHEVRYPGSKPPKLYDGRITIPDGAKIVES